MRNRTSLVAAAVAAVLMSTSALAASGADDAALTAKVKTALIGDKDTKARQINVESKAGTVQLNGFVDSADAKVEAERVARTVSGVTSVDNNLEVRAESRSAGVAVDDAVLTTKVKAGLIGDSATKASQINVDTSNGTVVLSGFVDSDVAKDRAVEIANDVEGVQKVQSKIVVKP